jgi:predicted NBD/HSP70 family sugar kinase
MTASGAPVRQSSVRAHNLALVLQTVANRADQPSRAAIATLTGLTRATVSALVDDLIGGGLLVELDPPPRTGAGRPAAGLALSPDGPAGLGLEINVDYLAACVVDLTGTVRHRVVRHLTRADPDALADLGLLAAEVAAVAAGEGLTPAGVTLAVPGLVTPEGIVRVAPNLGWQDVDVPARLGDLSGLDGLPISVDNEANLAALGELRAGGSETTFLYVSGEVGIGAGIVLDGDLYRGKRGWSGEIGHVTVYPDGRPCRCGANGCLEQYAGQEQVADDPELAASSLGIALSAVVNLLDIGVVVLGGAYAPVFDQLREGIEAELRRRVLTAELSPVVLRPAVLGADAAMRGAADTVVRSVRENPADWLSRSARNPV